MKKATRKITLATRRVVKKAKQVLQVTVKYGAHNTVFTSLPASTPRANWWKTLKAKYDKIIEAEITPLEGEPVVLRPRIARAVGARVE